MSYRKRKRTEERNFKSKADYERWLRGAKYYGKGGYSKHPEKVTIRGKPYHPKHRP